MSEPSVYVCDAVLLVEKLHQHLFDDSFLVQTIHEQLARQAQNLFKAHQGGNTAAAVEISNFLPRLAGASTDEIMASEFSIADAQVVLAREYGFDSWEQVKNEGNKRSDPEFESAVDSVVSGKANILAALLKTNPALVCRRSQFKHQATLLHYISANGVEIRRQKIPHNAVEIARILIAAGANVNAKAHLYGGYYTTMAMLISSAHPSDAGVQDALIKVLLEAGAASETTH
jgi:hypothetical protein